jgi:hypothetical protein
MTEALKRTRESWLESAVDIFRPRFIEVGLPLPELIHVSVGFAYGARQENGKVLGQCWARQASDDGANHVFISPEIGDTFDVLETLLHELIHAADDCKSGHKGEFAKAATRLGLLSPMTFTPASPEVQAELLLIAVELGDYPHGALHPTMVKAKTPVPVGAPLTGTTKLHSGPAKQTARMIKCSCATCGYTVRTSRRWIDVALPICPVDLIAMEEG